MKEIVENTTPFFYSFINNVFEHKVTPFDWVHKDS